jgi:hypothetical protein
MHSVDNHGPSLHPQYQLIILLSTYVQSTSLLPFFPCPNRGFCAIDHPLDCNSY